MKNLQKGQTPNIHEFILDSTKIQYITLLIDFEESKGVPLTLAIPYIFDEDKVTAEKIKIKGIEISKASDMPDGVGFEAPGSKEVDLSDLKETLDSIVGDLSDEWSAEGQEDTTEQEGSPEASEIPDKGE